jgi:hypothetical protein
MARWLCGAHADLSRFLESMISSLPSSISLQRLNESEEIVEEEGYICRKDMRYWELEGSAVFCHSSPEFEWPETAMIQQISEMFDLYSFN